MTAPSAASFSLSTNDTTVSKFPTSELNLLFREFVTTAAAEAEAKAEELKAFGNDLFKEGRFKEAFVDYSTRS